MIAIVRWRGEGPINKDIQGAEEDLDRLRAYHSGLRYGHFLKRRAELRLQAERILKIEKHKHTH